MAKRGRKSWDKELEMKKLWELSVPVLKYALECKDESKVSLSKKIEVAQHLLTKMLPKESKVDLTTEEPIRVCLELFDSGCEFQDERPTAESLPNP